MRGLNLRQLAVLLGLGICAAIAAPNLAMAAGQGIIAIAGDQPITQHDIDERIALLQTLGDTQAASQPRKAILRSLVDEVVKRSEAAKYKTTPTDIDITKQVKDVAKGMNMSNDQLLAKLKARGISESAFRTYLLTQIGFNRVIGSKYPGKFTVTDADVNRKMGEMQSTIKAQLAKIMSDPRMQAITVYSLMEINFPVETPDDVGLVQARAVDAQQVASRFKGCGSARSAAAGVYNVQVGKTVEADAAKLPPQMRQALDKAGIGRAIGPMRSKTGIQLLAFCGSRRIVPPKPQAQLPTRDQVKNLLENQKFGTLEEDYLKTARKTVYVEYRDPSYAP